MDFRISEKITNSTLTSYLCTLCIPWPIWIDISATNYIVTHIWGVKLGVYCCHVTFWNVIGTAKLSGSGSDSLSWHKLPGCSYGLGTSLGGEGTMLNKIYKVNNTHTVHNPQKLFRTYPIVTWGMDKLKRPLHAWSLHSRGPALIS